MSGATTPSVLCGAGSDARPVSEVYARYGHGAADTLNKIRPAQAYAPPSPDWAEDDWFTEPEAPKPQTTKRKR